MDLFVNNFKSTLCYVLLWLTSCQKIISSVQCYLGYKKQNYLKLICAFPYNYVITISVISARLVSWVLGHKQYHDTSISNQKQPCAQVQKYYTLPCPFLNIIILGFSLTSLLPVHPQLFPCYINIVLKIQIVKRNPATNLGNLYRSYITLYGAKKVSEKWLSTSF